MDEKNKKARIAALRIKAGNTIGDVTSIGNLASLNNNVKKEMKKAIKSKK